MLRDISKLLESREEVSEGEESSFDNGRLKALAAQLPILQGYTGTVRGLSLASQTTMRGMESGLRCSKKKLWANF